MDAIVQYVIGLVPASLHPILVLIGTVLGLLEVLISVPQLAAAKGLWEKAKSLPIVLSVVSALEGLGVSKPPAPPAA